MEDEDDDDRPMRITEKGRFVLAIRPVLQEYLGSNESVLDCACELWDIAHKSGWLIERKPVEGK